LQLQQNQQPASHKRGLENLKIPSSSAGKYKFFGGNTKIKQISQLLTTRGVTIFRNTQN
jgi:hypothetical protein